MQPRLLAVVAHPDDEAFFFGGTLARCAPDWHTRLVVVTDGAHGKQARTGTDGRVLTVDRPRTADERSALGRLRRAEMLDSARALGLREVEFLSWEEETLGSRRQLVLCALRRRIRDFDPTVVITLNEAGTTAHADHSWVALLTYRAIVESAHASADRAAGGNVPEASAALAGYFTFTLTQAADRFDYWGEMVVPDESVVEVDVTGHVEGRLRACRAHRSQAHWLEYLDGLDLLDRPSESFVPRWLPRTAPGRGGLPDGSPFSSTRPRRAVPMPLPHGSRYSSSTDTLDGDIRTRVGALDTDRLRAVVLASGHGTRMGNPGLPKSLEPVGGRPIVRHIVRSLELADVDESPVVVTGPGGELVRDELAGSCVYVDQGVPLGTGHAVACTKALLETAGTGHVLVLNGDMPLLTPETLREVVVRHLAGDHPVTLGVVRLDGEAGPSASFSGHGRVVRDASGGLVGITEVRDADARTAQLAEVNAGVYCFRADWLWPALDRLDDDNAQSELYLTDVVRQATARGEVVVTVDVPRDDALGVNTRADLAVAEEVYLRRSAVPPRTTTVTLG